MKNILQSTRTTTRLAAILTLMPTIVAADFTEFVGSWRTHGLETPARLRERFYNEVTEQFRTGSNASATAQPNEIIVDVFFSDPFAAVNTTFNMAANGNISGGAQAQFRSFKSNRFTYQDDYGVFTVFSNITGDILKRSDATPDIYNMFLALKSPEALTVSDLAGTWDVVSYTTPQNIEVHKAGGRVVDAFILGGFRSFSATITIDSDGEIDGDFKGTADVTGPGSVSFEIDESTFNFSINASKNTMTGGFSQDNEREYLVLVKRPESLSTPELEGNWRFTALEVPRSFRKTFYNEVTEEFRTVLMPTTAGENEQFVDIFHIGEFSNLRLDLHVGEDGSFSQLGGGTLSAGMDNKASLFVDNKTIVLNPNADKTMLTGLISDANSQILIIGIRVQGEIANTFNESVELGMAPLVVEEPLVISWKGASYLKLQAYNSEEGVWEDVDFTDGLDSMAVDPEEYGNTGLFRIIEVAGDDDDEEDD